MANHQMVPGMQFMGQQQQQPQQPFGDTTYTKIFVGGLAWETKSDTLRRYFEPFGEILEAVVISDKNTGRSKGYGFVSNSCWTTILMFVFLLLGFDFSS